jgi:hypothetical protein
MTQRILLSLVMWFLASMPSYACYFIQTKGAGEFHASSYWKEEGEIRFSMPNGIMGVAESEILNITRVNDGSKPIGCRWAVDPVDQGLEDDQSSRESAEVAEDTNLVVTAATDTLKSAAVQQFETGVAAFEAQLQRIGTMSSDELFDLARTAESLKRNMIAANEGNALNPLLLKVYAGLEQIESMIRP